MQTTLVSHLSDGVILRKEALAVGWTDKQLRAAVARGDLLRIRQGAYADRRQWESSTSVERHRMLCVAVVRAYGTHVLLSHQSAAVWHGCPIWRLNLDYVHITHIDGTARHGARVVHHAATVDRHDRDRDPRVTTPTRTALDVARSAELEPALVVVDDLLHRKLTTSEALARGAEAMTDWPGTLTHHMALRLADGRHESPGETLTAYMLFQQDLPAPIPQFEVFRPDGSLAGRVDFAWPELGVIVEFDGREKYLRYRREGESIIDAVLREKAREDEIRELTGWIVIRLTWSDLRTPRRVVARILAARRLAA